MSSNGSLKAAEEAAAKVNAMLVATGQLRSSDVNKNRNKTGKQTDLFVEKVVINDAPISARNYLTRSSTQEEISKMSGASVSTRGRYMTKEEIDKNISTDRPLFLHIQGVNEQDVKVAVGRIMHLIMEHTHRKKPPLQQQQQQQKNRQQPLTSNSAAGATFPLDNREMANFNNATPHSNLTAEAHTFPQAMFREKVFLPINVTINPVEARVRLAGENNSNLEYIKNETGASIFMRGIGSGFIEPSLGMESQESLHFYLEHSNDEKFNEAKSLVVNLAQTILVQFQHDLAPPQTQQQHTQIQFTPTLPPAAPIAPVGQQAVFQPPLQTSVALNVNVPPPSMMNQVSIPPPGMVEVHNLIQTPISTPSHQVTMQVNPFSVPVIMNPPQQTTNLAQHTVSQTSELPSMESTAQMIPISIPSSVSAVDIISHPLVHTSMAPQQLVQTTIPPQQLIQTSIDGHQLVQTQQMLQLPQAPQIVSTPDGTRVINFAPTSSATGAFVAPTVLSRDSQGLVSEVINQPNPQLQMPPPVVQTFPLTVSLPPPPSVPQPVSYSFPPSLSKTPMHLPSHSLNRGLTESNVTVSSTTYPLMTSSQAPSQVLGSRQDVSISDPNDKMSSDWASELSTSTNALKRALQGDSIFSDSEINYSANGSATSDGGNNSFPWAQYSHVSQSDRSCLTLSDKAQERQSDLFNGGTPSRDEHLSSRSNMNRYTSRSSDGWETQAKRHKSFGATGDEASASEQNLTLSDRHQHVSDFRTSGSSPPDKYPGPPPPLPPRFRSPNSTFTQESVLKGNSTRNMYPSRQFLDPPPGNWSSWKGQQNQHEGWGGMRQGARAPSWESSSNRGPQRFNKPFVKTNYHNRRY